MVLLYSSIPPSHCTLHCTMSKFLLRLYKPVHCSVYNIHGSAVQLYTSFSLYTTLYNVQVSVAAVQTCSLFSVQYPWFCCTALYLLLTVHYIVQCPSFCCGCTNLFTVQCTISMVLLYSSIPPSHCTLHCTMSKFLL